MARGCFLAFLFFLKKFLYSKTVIAFGDACTKRAVFCNWVVYVKGFAEMGVVFLDIRLFKTGNLFLKGLLENKILMKKSF